MSRSDNVLSGARALNLSSGRVVARDRVGGDAPRDFFQFQLGQRSQLTLSARSQRSNARVVLLDAVGRVLRRLPRPQKGSASIQQTLDPGTYHIRVVPQQRSRDTKYRLVLTANPLAQPVVSSPSRPPATASSSGVDKSRFNIRFDYRFDTNGWFTPQRRAALEVAARIWENIILDDFPEVPAGTRTYGVFNPQTGQWIREGMVNNTVIDDLVIFVGARDLGFSGSGFNRSPILAQAAPAGNREARITGNQFRPWMGSIAFDLDSGGSPTRWFFDPTPETANDIPTNQIDFISTAVHEIGHVLGFGTSQAFDRLTAPIDPARSSERGFWGINARAVNGGNPIPLSGGHVQEGYEFGGSGESMMDVKIAAGVRTLPNRLDVAILNDIGYTVNYAAAVQNPSARTSQRASNQPQSSAFNRLADSSGLGYRCGCAGCLMGVA
ncbi:hypothetical protein [Egbenema bharatensis]|uniref:hypothetical protein n=1 Tax=Egbenema bharatensis TaxID=3463334 RepID=UPI003A8A29DC